MFCSCNTHGGESRRSRHDGRVTNSGHNSQVKLDATAMYRKPLSMDWLRGKNTHETHTEPMGKWLVSGVHFEPIQ